MPGNTNSGRKGGFRLTDEHRAKISNSKILSRLIEHAEGVANPPMEATQVTAAIALLKKILPDLQATQISGEEGGPLVVKVTLGGGGS